MELGEPEELRKSLMIAGDDDIHSLLFRAETSEYGDRYIEHLLEQYKLYVEATDKISDRRQKTNEFFLALNTALLGLLGFIDAKYPDRANVMFVLTPIAGMILCYCWFAIIRAYKGLNTGKFSVIHAIESRLPLALYATEWAAVGRGKNAKLYKPFTHIELNIPWVFFSLYLFVLVSNVPWSQVYRIIHSLH